MLSVVTTDDERGELVRLVTFLMSAEGTEQEQDAALRSLNSRVQHPRVWSLIFWPSREGFDRELTAEEVVDIALAYQAVEL